MCVYAVENRRSTWYIGVKRTKMAFQNMVNMQLMMFLLVAVGFLVRKKNIIGGQDAKTWSISVCMLHCRLISSIPFRWNGSGACSKSFAHGSASCDRVLYSFYNNELYLLQKG